MRVAPQDQADGHECCASDVMLREPVVLPETATLGDARTVFLRDHVHMVLLTRTGRVGDPLLGTILRSDLAAAARRAATAPGPGDLALTSARLTGRTVHPAQCVDDVRRVLVEAGLRRAAVVDDAGLLVGLLCLKRDGTGFCSDSGVASRRAAAVSRGSRAR